MARIRNAEESVDLLDDADMADTQQTFYRRGRNGHLHATSYCWASGGAATRPVRLTWREALTKRVCSRGCFERSLPPALAKAIELAKGATALSLAEHLAQADDMEGLGRALGHFEIAERLIALPDSAGVDKAQQRLRDRLDRSRAACAERVYGHGDVIVRQISVDLIEVQTGRNPKYRADVPDCSELVSRRLGDVVAGQRLPMDAEIYKAWQEHRQKGTSEQARAAALEELRNAKLTFVTQLRGVPVDSADSGGGDSYDAASAGWKQTVTADVNSLVDAWERQYQVNVTDGAPMIVGVDVNTSWFIHNNVKAVLQAFPHVQRDGHIVGVYPSVAAAWLSGQSEQGFPAPQVHPGDATAEDLEVIATLWSPSRFSEGAYASLSVAVAAARKL